MMPGPVSSTAGGCSVFLPLFQAGAGGGGDDPDFKAGHVVPVDRSVFL